MKKILAIGLIAMMSFSLVACGGGSKENGSSSSARIDDPLNFDGASVAVQTGTTAANSINKLKEDQEVDVHEYEQITQGFSDLKLGRVDAVYVDSVVAAYYTNDSKDFEMTWKSDEGEPMAICLGKDNEALFNAIEAGIDTLYYDGTMAKLADKNFGEDFTADLREVTEKPTIPGGYKTIAEGTLTVGAEVGYPPMEYTTEDGKDFVGFDIDVADALGELLGLDVKFVNTSFDGIFAGLEKGQYDCIISAVSITKDRQEKYLLTKPYVSNALCIVTQASDK
ncbi:MAG: transporter substrate-binding domain-containing protein [Clostridiales Family XIII bacterium]|nr:transporter substrate-binding domain-containing protein [Clostridiales Family XIII bacterium]